jgi:protein-S-isoprenylcysteine O-methyltransferase Ste14
MEEIAQKSLVHRILARSYAFYFFGFLLGIIFDFIFPLHLPTMHYLGLFAGLIFIMGGSFIIFWAQGTTRSHHKEGGIVTKKTFYKGPYKFVRSPTHFGIAILLLGFGFLTNAFFVVVFTLIAFIVTKFTFLRKEEDWLEEKYGKAYLEYKEIVRL